MNSGVGDTFDLTWKLVSVLRGYGGEHVLKSYDHERRAVAKTNAKRVEEAVSAFLPLFGYAATVGHDVIHSDSEAGEKSRSDLKSMIEQAHWIHSQEGTFFDYSYHSSINVQDPSGIEPPRQITKYIPSTWPGVRAPHVYLSDGVTSIFDLYGPDFTIVDFTQHGELSTLFCAVAKAMGIPIKRVSLPSENHVRGIWQRDAVLVRPDGHVAWCAPANGVDSLTIGAIKDALAIATGRKMPADYQMLPELQEEMFIEVAPEERLQQKNEMLVEDKNGRNEQLEDASLSGVAKEFITVIDQKQAPDAPNGTLSPLEEKLGSMLTTEVEVDAGLNGAS